MNLFRNISPSAQKKLISPALIIPFNGNWQNSFVLILWSEYLLLNFYQAAIVEKLTRWLCYVLRVLLTTMCKGIIIVNVNEDFMMESLSNTF